MSTGTPRTMHLTFRSDGKTENRFQGPMGLLWGQEKQGCNEDLGLGGRNGERKDLSKHVWHEAAHPRTSQGCSSFGGGHASPLS